MKYTEIRLPHHQPYTSQELRIIRFLVLLVILAGTMALVA